MTRRIIAKAELQAIGKVRDYASTGYKFKPDGIWQFEATVQDPSLAGTPHGTEFAEVTIHPPEERQDEIEDPPQFVLAELLGVLEKLANECNQWREQHA